MKVCLYCPFRHSLGHVARTGQIAAALRERGALCTLVFGGARPPGFEPQDGVRVLALPESRCLDGVPDPAVLADRSRLIREAMREADACVVDYHPLGLNGELLDTLECAAQERWPVRFYWGIPYPGKPGPPPRNPRVRRALERYDCALGYSDAGWLDPFESHQSLPANRVHVGVVAPLPPSCRPVRPPVVVGLAGAGIGARPVYEIMLRAAAPLARDGRLGLRFVAGQFREGTPCLDEARRQPGVEVLGHGSAEGNIVDASAVVSRAGYNTAYLLAQTDLPLMFIPYCSPDPRYTEQYDRARRLSTLPGIRWVDERDENAVQRVSR
ncbi:MAG: hypothetical protein HY815_01140, partial [Candidatus Riflebacteria bacterium]|nr:hypothetical protein [Candidatus Riflebacteria bacterium]